MASGKGTVNTLERKAVRAVQVPSLFQSDLGQWVIGFGLVIGIGFSGAILLPPVHLFSREPEDISRVIGVVLQAQAAMMAITLAVMAFIVGGIHRRRDTDDPLYEWFLDKARIRPVFALTALSTLGTAAAYFLVELGIGEPEPNLLLFTGASFAVSILTTVGFALWALRTLQPSRYRDHKRAVTIRQVRSASTGYAEEVIQSDSPDLRQLVWLPSEGRAADRAIERIIDDAERSIRDGRFVDFRDSMDLLSECADVAIEAGTPDLQQLPPFVTMDHFSDWPIRRPLHHGFYRLRATALREGREDYANLVHEQCVKWLRIGTFQEHILLADLAVEMLAVEYRITQRYSGSVNLRLEWSTQRLIRVTFEHLITVAVNEDLEISNADRCDISLDLIGRLHDWAGDLLARNELDSLGVWLDRAGDYVAVLSWEGTEANRLGTIERNNRPSILSHMRLSVAAIAGRALQGGNDAALDLWLGEMDHGTPPVFPSDQVASDMSLLRWTPPLAVLDETWKRWLEHDTSRRHRPLSKSNRYPLLCYLWLAAREGSIRSVQPDARIASELRSLYRRNRTLLLNRVPGDENRRSTVDGALREWLDLALPGKNDSDA